jgi:hypothetical protein
LVVLFLLSISLSHQKMFNKQKQTQCKYKTTQTNKKEN